MKARISTARISCARLLSLLLILMLPAGLQGQFNYVTNGGAITLTGYTGPGGDVEIPSEIDGLPVTSISYYAFYRCFSLTSVTIPDGVNGIGSYAFGECYSLRSVAIGNSLTNIGEYAFGSCASLTRITIPDSVISIGDSAFNSCISLTNVTIPDNVTSIGYGPFSRCSSLTAITVKALNTVYCDVHGVLFNRNRTTLIQWPGDKAGSCAIPDSVTSIWEEAFAGGGNLTGVTIGNSVVSIGDCAFSQCARLTGVSIPDSVTSIGDGVFCGCTSLTNVTIGNSVISIGSDAFRDCFILTGVYLRGNAPFVGAGVFDGVTNATVYFLPGTTSWESTFGGRPTAPWYLPYPAILSLPPSFGVLSNGFGFTSSWATNTSVVVEAATNLANPFWLPVGTNSLTMGIDPPSGGWSCFSDPDWTNYPARFYRLRSL